MLDDKINKKMYEKIASKIQKGLERAEDDPRLLELSSIEDFNDGDIVAILKAFYDSDNMVYRRIGTILNAIFTHGHNVFVITQKYMNDLLEKDVLITANSCDGKTYKKVLKAMYDLKLMVCLRTPVKNDLGVSGKAGLYEIVDEDILSAMAKSIGENNLLAKRNKFIEWFDKNNPDYEYKLTEQDRLENEKDKEAADAIFGRK